MADLDKRIEDLSDEEIAGMTAEQFAALDAAQSGGSAAATRENDEAGADNAQAAANTQDEDEAARLAAEEAAATAAEAADAKGDAHENVSEASATNGAATGQGSDAKTDEDKEVADKDVTDADKAKAADTKAIDPAQALSQLDALYAPFKANGRDMQVQSVEEARQLMQMGANYNKKMQAMKPHLTTLRMLENAGIKDSDLTYLIDLHKKDPAAINKLVSESKIDPMDLSAEKAAGYKPGNHRPPDYEVELDAVISELQGSVGYDRTLDVVANKMDPASKQVIAQKPAILKVINQHIESGIYDLVNAEVERQRVFNQLAGLSDLEAYRQVGDAMHAQGRFAHLENKAGQPSPQGQQVAAAPVVAAPNPKKADDSKRDAQKRAVAPVRGAAPGGKAANTDFNPLSLSDEEFAKQFNRK